MYGSADDGLDGPHTPLSVPSARESGRRQPPRPSPFRWTIAIVSACAAVAYTLASTRPQRNPPALALNEERLQSSAEGVKNVDGGITEFLSLFKRTFASLEPQRDGEWLSSTFGLEQTAAEFWQDGVQYGSESTDADGVYQTACMRGEDCCAERAAMSSLDGSFTFHQFRSWMTPAGELSPEYWINYWNNLHGNFSAAGSGVYEWDAFMMLLTGFYTPDLTQHVKRMRGSGTPMLARTYTNPIDGVTMYSIWVNDPFTGHIYQISADHVDSAYKGLFLDIDESSCQAALMVDQSASKLNQWWRHMNGTMQNDQGFPDLLVTHVTQPTANVSAVRAYWENFDFLPWNWTHAPKVGTEQYPCSFLANRVQVSSVTVDGEQENVFAVIRYVEAPKQRVGKHSVKDYSDYVDATHKANMGRNRGWDRWIDFHLGLNIGNDEYLDDLKLPFDKANPLYHAHGVPQQDTPNDGSIFAAGPSALAFEWHGTFDYSAFNETKMFWPASLNFCSATSTCAANVSLCDGSTGTSNVQYGDDHSTR